MRTGHLTSFYALAAALSVIAPANGADRQPDICGYVTYSETPSGIYHIPTASGQTFENIALMEVARPRGAVLAGDRYYIAEMIDDGILGGEQYYIHTYDAQTWQPIGERRATDFTLMATDVALDPASGIIYGCFAKEYETSTGEVTAYRFGAVDYGNLSVRHIADLSTPLISMAVDTDGTLYAVNGDNHLVTVDKTTGALTDIGTTGIPFYDGSVLWNVSAVIDPETGKLYSSQATLTGGALYEINKTTGRARRSTAFAGGELVLGLFIPAPEADADAPALVEDLRIVTDKASLDANAQFTLPSLSYSGTQLNNSLSWTLAYGDGRSASGSGEPGTKVTAGISVPHEGEYNFTLTVSNQVGDSPKAQTVAYLGNDVPCTPEACTAVYSDGAFSLSWDAVTAGIHGGYVDLDDLTYSVVRYPEGQTVADGIKSTSLKDPLPIPSDLTVYHYTVTASASGKTSAPALSGKTALGEINPPYYPDFSAPDALEQFTIIDANGDNRSWRVEKGMLTIPTAFESQADDWAITPPIHLEKDKSYRLTFAAASSSAERFETLEVMLGTAPAADAMTETVLPSTVIKASVEAPLRTEYIIRPRTDGAYYIGFHGQSPMGTMFLHVFDVDITAGMKGSAPSAPANLKGMPSADASVKAAISFTAPDKSLDGTPLPALTKAEVYCNRIHAATLSDLKPGKEISFEHSPGTASGVYTYRIVPYSEDGPGMPAACTLFLGANIPGQVIDLKAVETDGDGEVCISWQAPATDADGYYIHPAIVTYDIFDAYDPKDPKEVATGLTDLSYTYRYCPKESRQDLAQWYVVARTSAGYGNPAVTPYLAVGLPYEAPYEESFSNGHVHHNIYSTILNGTEKWDINDESFGITPQDNDGGYATFAGGFSGYSAALVSGKIRIPAERPGVIFYSYNIQGGIENENLVAFEVNDGSGWKTVRTMVMKDLPLVNGWTPVAASLAEYAGKTVTTRFVATTVNYATTLVDNIFIGSLAEVNISPVAVKAPESATYGEPFDLTVWVANKGASDSGPYELTLVRDGKDVRTVTVSEPAKATDYTRYVFNDVLSPEASGDISYRARLASEEDLDWSDNISPETLVAVVREIYPAVRNLSAEMAGENVRLAWNVPDYEGFIVPVTEGFEEADAFSIDNVRDWTFIDADGGETYGIKGWDFPGSGSPMAYIVFDSREVPAAVTDREWYAAHGGYRYLVSMAARPSPTVDHNDDWLVSPRLSGDAQTISLYAKSIDVAYGYEQFEVYASDGGTEIKDFRNISGKYPVTVPQGWTRFSFELPEGSRHFAIRCISPDFHALFIDDITYTPAEATATLELAGYDVWRDGVRLTATPIAATDYSDTPGDYRMHTYNVTAVYNFGKSAPSETVSASADGITDAIADRIAIRTVPGAVEISGLSSGHAEIYSPDGLLLTRLDADGSTIRQSLPAGVYIVRAAGRVVKIRI